MALLDRIKFDGTTDGSQWLIYKVPGEEFKLGSQLIVGQGQEALFLKGGAVADLFGPGAHTLKSGNLPLLNKLVKLPFGGSTPFTAEVYYVNKTSRLDMNWGTANPFQLEDPQYGLILSIRCHGKYGIRIADTGMFVSSLVGSLPHGSVINYMTVASYFSGLLTSRIKSAISAFMIRQKISFLEVTAYLKELSKECESEVANEFERFGLEVVNFFIESISPPKEEYEKLRVAKERRMDAMTDIDIEAMKTVRLGQAMAASRAAQGYTYQDERKYDVMQNAAQNEGMSGTLMGAGMGLGMGFGMGPAMGNMFNSLNDNMTANAAKPAGANENVCPHCGAQNPAGQKFCGECGKTMVVGVVCPNCGKVNGTGQKFCGDCGTKLSKVCPSCGKENDMNQKFCGDCGTKL